MSLESAIKQFRDANPGRIARLEYQGQAYWIKEREELSWGMWLRKGNAAKAFDQERQALKDLADLDLPVARIVAEGPDYFVLKDAGDALKHILRSGRLTSEERITAFQAAGRALAKFHKQGISHGRPAIIDILWDGASVTFIDFERYSSARNSTRGGAMDFIFFVHSALSVSQMASPELEAAVQAYFQEGDQRVWQDAQKICKRAWWLGWLVKPYDLRPPGKARDMRAIPMTLEYFKKDRAGAEPAA